LIEQPVSQKARYRVNISTTSKGLVSYDVTAEIHDPDVSDMDRELGIAAAYKDAMLLVLKLNKEFGKAQEDGIPVNVILDVRPRGSKGDD
tara:strand:- start:10269 stop:10538 length:270 start_codon:yes stop_codon:yes gene_type:complete